MATSVVPPIIYIRLLDSDNNPVRNASCFADIQTQEGYTEHKPLTEIIKFQQLECLGREECPYEDYFGYYRLDVTNYSYERLFWIFQRATDQE